MNWSMKNWSIGHRVSFVFTLMLGCMVALFALSLYSMQDVIRKENSHTQIFVPAEVLATGFEREVLNARINFIYYVTIQKPDALDKGWERYHNAETRLRDLQMLVNAHEELRPLRPAVAKLKEDLDAYAPALQSTLAMVQGGATSGDAYNAQVQDWAAKGAAMVTDAGNVETLCTSAGVAPVGSVMDGLRTAGLMYVLVFVGGALLSAVLARWTVRKINAVLQGSVAELGDASVQIASAANQVSASSQSLAQGSNEQGATIEETSKISTEINSISSQTTENTRIAAEKMTQSDEMLGKTNQSLAEMVNAMDRINGSSQKISKIIKVIDEIAFQTNILALNAAVEAARAGEAGMGFAVVADEVRNLAMRCAQAARDTTDLIEESIHNSKDGRVKVDQVAVAIRAITAESSNIKDLIDEISLGSVEQSRGIDQISKSILQMEQVTQSSAASAEESAAAAEQLNAQAEAMKEIVERLRAMVDGGNGSTHGGDSAEPRLHLSGAAARLAESGI
jgi:hypothetical protein